MYILVYIEEVSMYIILYTYINTIYIYTHTGIYTYMYTQYTQYLHFERIALPHYRLGHIEKRAQQQLFPAGTVLA